jgi:hypothetical protein
MATPKIKVKDDLWKKIKGKFVGLKHGLVASVGVQGEKASQDHGELTNATLMAYHEYGDRAGLGRPPERAPLRSTLAANQSTYNQELAKLAKGVFEGGTLEGNLYVLGEQYKGDILKRMNEGLPAPKTGELAHLVQTGQLRNSMSTVVKDIDEVIKE